MNRIYTTRKERLAERTNCDCCGKSLLIAHYLSNDDLVGSECAQDIQDGSSRIKYGNKPYPWTLPAVMVYLEKQND